MRLTTILFLSISIVSLMFMTGCGSSAHNFRTRLPASRSAFDAIEGRAASAGCNVGFRDDEFPILLIDCADGRIAFQRGTSQGDDGTLRPTIATDDEAKREVSMEASCVRGLRKQCQEYAERLLGVPVTSEERRVPLGPNPLVRPEGQGWFCHKVDVMGIQNSVCLRSAEECADLASRTRGKVVEPCKAVEKAYCATYGTSHESWQCSATLADCTRFGNKPTETQSACGAWE